MISNYFLPLQKKWLSQILPKMHCLKYFLVTPLCRAYPKTTKIVICFYSVEYDLNVLFDLAEIAAIFDFTHNAMSNVLSGHTTISDIYENPMVDTKIMNMLMFC